uniref:Uncharacterized protein n=1 Tax=Arundo donax TaxID=35708 RepID=A0A0A9FRH8_ARUDO
MLICYCPSLFHAIVRGTACHTCKFRRFAVSGEQVDTPNSERKRKRKEGRGKGPTHFQ